MIRFSSLGTDHLLAAGGRVYTGKFAQSANDTSVECEDHWKSIQQGRRSSSIDEEHDSCHDPYPAVANTPANGCNLEHSYVSLEMSVVVSLGLIDSTQFDVVPSVFIAKIWSRVGQSSLDLLLIAN